MDLMDLFFYWKKWEKSNKTSSIMIKKKIGFNLNRSLGPQNQGVDVKLVDVN